MNLVQLQIELENIYAGLAKKSELALFGMLPHESPQIVLTDLAFFSHARDLKLGRGRRNVRI